MTTLKELVETKAKKAEYSTRGVKISDDTAKVILEKIKDIGAFSLPRTEVNASVGWSDKAIGNQRLKAKLNKEHALDGMKWHVGHNTKTDRYVFTTKSI